VELLIPQLQFSPWKAWENRETYPLVEFPGVYLISITAKADLEEQVPQFGDVGYIGMTNDLSGLKGRWKAFDRAINAPSYTPTEKIRGHSGGKTIWLANGPYPYWDKLLYVSAFAVQCNVEKPTDRDFRLMGLVAYLEYEAFARYYQVAGGYPPYNKAHMPRQSL
jgi:hypothetical protein